MKFESGEVKTVKPGDVIRIDVDDKTVQDEVWKFIRMIASELKDSRFDNIRTQSIFGGCLGLYDLVTCHTYSEAKEMYEKWEDSHEDIHIGDEVIYKDNIRCVVLRPETDDKYGKVLELENMTTHTVENYDLTKTGRAFPELVELINKIKGE